MPRFSQRIICRHGIVLNCIVNYRDSYIFNFVNSAAQRWYVSWWGYVYDGILRRDGGTAAGLRRIVGLRMVHSGFDSVALCNCGSPCSPLLPLRSVFFLIIVPTSWRVVILRRLHAVHFVTLLIGRAPTATWPIEITVWILYQDRLTRSDI
jgi:hypothetical protein